MSVRIEEGASVALQVHGRGTVQVSSAETRQCVVRIALGRWHADEECERRCDKAEIVWLGGSLSICAE